MEESFFEKFQYNLEELLCEKAHLLGDFIICSVTNRAERLENCSDCFYNYRSEKDAKR